jgi:hypothetical protein
MTIAAPVNKPWAQMQTEPGYGMGSARSPERLVTVLRSEPDLNPYGSDLEEAPSAGCALSRAYDVSAPIGAPPVKRPC